MTSPDPIPGRIQLKREVKTTDQSFHIEVWVNIDLEPLLNQMLWAVLNEPKEIVSFMNGNIRAALFRRKRS